MDSLDCSGRDGERYSFFELRNINPLFLEVKLAAVYSRRIELRRARAVAVASGALRTSFCYRTSFHEIEVRVRKPVWS